MSDTEEKKFVLKRLFRNDCLYSVYTGKQETYYNVPWCLLMKIIEIRIENNMVSDTCLTKLTCSKPRGANDDWSIAAEIEMRLNGSHVENKHIVFSQSVNFVKFEIEYSNRMKEVEFHVTIIKMTGMKIKKLRDFDDESARKFSDVVLKVEDQKFHVNKMYLATHSTYFESLLLGNFQESGQSEIELNDIDPEDLQNFLELVYAETLVKDTTVEGIVHLADFFDSKTVIRRCEDFLLEKSKKSLKLKFELAVKYNLDDLRRNCLSKMRTADDVVSVIPEDSSQFDHTVWKELLWKCYAVKE